MHTRTVMLGMCLMLISGQTFAADAAQVEKGRALAFQLCASCHQVSAAQRRPMRVYNPKTHTDQEALSLMEIAKRNGRDAQFLENILDEPHYPMRKKVFNAAEKRAIIAYIQSLADAAR
jgi:mono/diheme cytochrome c family protein